MRSFQYTTALPRLFCGPASLGHIGRELGRLGCHRAVVFCGTSLARDVPTLELVKSSLGERCAGVFAGVKAHSPLPAVLAAARELKRLDADAVVPVGGGSAVVTARAAAILAAENADIRSLCTMTNERGELHSPRLLAPKLPQLVVPTTPTTATVKAGTAVFDPASGERLAMFDPKTRAQSVFIHPELVKTAPHELLLTASLDTFTLALEGLASLAANPISDALLMHAVRLLATHLQSQRQSPDLRARCELALAAVLCGQGTDSTGAGIATVLGHAIGGRYGAENGTVKAIVMTHVLDFNAEAAQAGLRNMAIALDAHAAGSDSILAVVNHVLQRIFAGLGPVRLRDIGVPKTDLADVAAVAMGDWLLRGNPRPVRSPGELQQVLEAAW